MAKYTVTLKSVGNPDYGQDPDRPLYGVDNEIAEVDTLPEASRACRAYIEENDLGGGNWSGGEVKDEDGTVVARVSYNGRVWPPGEWTGGQVSLWSPGEPEHEEPETSAVMRP